MGHRERINCKDGMFVKWEAARRPLREYVAFLSSARHKQSGRRRAECGDETYH